MSKKLGKIATRYAKAYLGSFKSEKKLNTITGAQLIENGIKDSIEELRALGEAIHNNLELKNAIFNPAFLSKERLSAILAIFKLSDLNSRFVSFLFDRKRIQFLLEIIQKIESSVESISGEVPVRVTSASALSVEERSSIEQSLKIKLKSHISGGISGGEVSKFIFNYDVRPEIIGGLKVEFAGRVIDGSVGGRLSEISRVLEEAY